jgi:hypothetical protein
MAQMSGAEKLKLLQGLSFFEQCAISTLFSSYAQSKGVSCSEIKMLQMSTTALWKVSAAKKIIFYVVCLITVGIWYIVRYFTALRDLSDGKHVLCAYFSFFIACNALPETMPQHMRADAMKISHAMCVNAGITDPKNLAVMERVRNGQLGQSLNVSSNGGLSATGAFFGSPVPPLTNPPSNSSNGSSSDKVPPQNNAPSVGVPASNPTAPTAGNPPASTNPASLEVQRRRRGQRVYAAKPHDPTVPLNASGRPITNPEEHEISVGSCPQFVEATMIHRYNGRDVRADAIPQTTLAYALLAELFGLVSTYNGTVVDISHTRQDIDDAAKNISSLHRSLLSALEAAENEKRNRLRSLNISMLPQDIINCFNLRGEVEHFSDLQLPLAWQGDVPHVSCNFSDFIGVMLSLGISEEFISSLAKKSKYLGGICTDIQLDKLLNDIATIYALMFLLNELLSDYVSTFAFDGASLPTDTEGKDAANIFSDLKRRNPPAWNYAVPGEFPSKLSKLHAAFEGVRSQQKIDANIGTGRAGGLEDAIRGEPPPARKSNDEISKEALACFLAVLSEVVSNEGAIAESDKKPAVSRMDSARCAASSKSIEFGSVI